MAAFEGFDGHVQDGEVIGHEEGVEFRGFEFLREVGYVGEVEVGVWVGAWVAPCSGMEGDWAHEGCEVELSWLIGHVDIGIAGLGWGVVVVNRICEICESCLRGERCLDHIPRHSHYPR